MYRQYVDLFIGISYVLYAFIVCCKSLRTKSNGTYKQHTNAQVDDENASSYTILYSSYLLNGYTKLLFLTWVNRFIYRCYTYSARCFHTMNCCFISCCSFYYVYILLNFLHAEIFCIKIRLKKYLNIVSWGFSAIFTTNNYYHSIFNFFSKICACVSLWFALKWII